MDLIEKAARKIEDKKDTPLIERVAEQINSEAPPANSELPAPLATPAAQEPTTPQPRPPIAPAPGAPAARTVSTETPPAAAPVADAAPPRPQPQSQAPQAPQPQAETAAPDVSTLPPLTRHKIDLDRLHAAGMVTPRGDRTRIAEEFRRIKRPLLIKAFSGDEHQVDRGNLIMVTSAIPSEGKTFTTVNLAMSMAKERDVYVLLVDSDLSRPRVADALDLKPDKGFADLLEDENIDVGDVMMRTSIENFSVIPAGRPHPMGTELLASERAHRVIEEISHRYPNRIILFDSAPVLASNEGGALSRFVGQVVFVVEAEKTSESEVKGALEVLSACKHIGLVLNKARTRLSTGRLGGYYGSYYQEESA